MPPTMSEILTRLHFCNVMAVFGQQRHCSMETRWLTHRHSDEANGELPGNLLERMAMGLGD